MVTARDVRHCVYAGQLIVCSSHEYVRKVRVELMKLQLEHRDEVVTQVAACELRRLDEYFEIED